MTETERLDALEKALAELVSSTIDGCSTAAEMAIFETTHRAVDVGMWPQMTALKARKAELMAKSGAAIKRVFALAVPLAGPSPVEAAPRVFVGGGTWKGARLGVFCVDCLPDGVDLGSSDVEVWEEGSDGWTGPPICSSCRLSIPVYVDAPGAAEAPSALLEIADLLESAHDALTSDYCDDGARAGLLDDLVETAVDLRGGSTEPAASVWEDDTIQFPRLLDEIAAVGLSDEQMFEIESSMDLPRERVVEIMNRATARFEKHKASIREKK